MDVLFVKRDVADDGAPSRAPNGNGARAFAIAAATEAGDATRGLDMALETSDDSGNLLPSMTMSVQLWMLDTSDATVTRWYRAGAPTTVAPFSLFTLPFPPLSSATQGYVQLTSIAGGSPAAIVARGRESSGR